VPTTWPVMLARRLRKAMPMRFALEIGETEKNRLEFQFNQLLGSTIIKVNNNEVKKTVRYFSEPLLERHVVEVGKEERTRCSSKSTASFFSAKSTWCT